MKKEISFKQFLDIVLTELYKNEIRTQKSEYIDLPFVLQNIDYPEGWLWDAIDVLTSQGYIMSEKFLGGGCIAKLTGEGRMLKESGGQAGFVHEYEANPKIYTVVGDKNMVRVQKENSITGMINEIRKVLDSDKSIVASEKDDIKLDLEAIEKQLQKNKPKKNFIISTLESLLEYASLIKPVRTLLDHIDKVF